MPETTAKSSLTPWLVLGVVVVLGLFLFMRARGSGGGITQLPQNPGAANATAAISALAPVAAAEEQAQSNAQLVAAQLAAQTAAINASVETAQINAGVQMNAANRQAQTQQGSSILGTIATIGGALIGALL